MYTELSEYRLLYVLTYMCALTSLFLLDPVTFKLDGVLGLEMECYEQTLIACNRATLRSAYNAEHLVFDLSVYTKGFMYSTVL